MFIEVYDDDVPAVVWLFCGTENDDGDFARWLASMTRLDAALVASGRRAAALLIIDDGNPPPRPEEREGLTATARGIRGQAPLAVVTSSALARTLIAGLHLAGVVRFPLKGFADVATAVAWLAAQTKATAQTTAPALLTLVEEARARQAAKKT